MGEFVREIVGLDMNAAKEAFAQYLNDASLDSRQIYFVNQIVEYIVHNGMMKDLSVLQEAPFTDHGSIVEVFTDLSVWMGIQMCIRDRLYSTGIRVGELVNLNIDDMNFEARECVVFGKGDKERRVYFDAKAKLHLQNYLKHRTDRNPALFVTLDAPHDRLKISGVEVRLRELGRSVNLVKIHPHKFRRTMATRAIDKGLSLIHISH